MKTIWKYLVQVIPIQEIELPRGAKILAIQRQGKREDDPIRMWCIVDTEEPVEKRTFLIAGTGESLEDFEELEYITTKQFFQGAYPFHFFEIKKGKE